MTATVNRGLRASGKTHAIGQASVTRLLPRSLTVVLTIVLVAGVLAPVLYIVLASLNTDAGVAGGEFWPDQLQLGSYAKIWSTVDLASAMINSLLVSGSVAVVSALLATGFAFVLVRFAFRGRLTILRGLLALQSVPGTLMVLPVFVLFASIGTTIGVAVIGTLWGLFLAYLTFTLPFSTWVMVTYLRGFPWELEEAARMDGAGHLAVLFRIMVPLSWPGIIVSGIFAFLLGWNDVLFASVLTNPSSRTVAMALQVFGASQDAGPLPLYSQMMAAALVSALPVVMLYFVFQRFLVGGLTAGAVK